MILPYSATVYLTLIRLLIWDLNVWLFNVQYYTNVLMLLCSLLYICDGSIQCHRRSGTAFRRRWLTTDLNVRVLIWDLSAWVMSVSIRRLYTCVITANVHIHVCSSCAVVADQKLPHQGGGWSGTTVLQIVMHNTINTFWWPPLYMLITFVITLTMVPSQTRSCLPEAASALGPQRLNILTLSRSQLHMYAHPKYCRRSLEFASPRRRLIWEPTTDRLSNEYSRAHHWIESVSGSGAVPENWDVIAFSPRSAVFGSVVHGSEPGETPSNSASHQIPSYA